MEQKYCKYCGELIDFDCIVCPKCGKQVEELKTASQSGFVSEKIEYSFLLDVLLFFFLFPAWVIYVLARPKTKLVPIEEYNARASIRKEKEKKKLENDKKAQDNQSKYIAIAVVMIIIAIVFIGVLKIYVSG